MSVVGGLCLMAATVSAGPQKVVSNADLLNMINKLSQKVDQLEKENQALKKRVESLNQKQDSTEKQVAAVVVEAGPVSNMQKEEENLTVTTEYLYWQPSLGVLDFVTNDSSSTNRIRGDEIQVEPNNTAGFRIALGYEAPSNQTDLSLSLTQLDGDWSKKVKVSPGADLWGTRLHAQSVIDDNNVTQATADYEIDYMVWDVNIGYTSHINDSFEVRPYGGLRIAEIDQKFNIFYEQRITPIFRRTVDFKEVNKMSGVGLNLGIDSKWYWGLGFSLMTGVGGSLLLADTHYSQYQGDRPVGATKDLVRVDFKRDREDQLIPVVSANMGLTWEYVFQNNMMLMFLAGYEYQNWFNIFHQVRFTDDVDSQLGSSDDSDLGIHGPFIRAKVFF